jgi:formylglycine-generating enzyme required for sulfatase activity
MRTTLLGSWLACVACVSCAPAPGPAAANVPVAAVPTAGGVVAESPTPSLATTAVTSPDATAPAPEPVTSRTPSATDAAAPAGGCAEGEVPVPPTSSEGFVMAKGLPATHRVVLSRGFCVDESEVTVREYARCVESGACKEPWRGDPYSTYPSKLDEPVNLVNWSKARAYCAWAGKRLPSEAEWEWAATGPEQYRYPWGNEPEPSCELCDYTKFGAPKWVAGGDIGCGGGGPSPVGSHPKGDRIWPGGAIHDLAGNVWEWVEDSYAPLGGDTVTDPAVHLETSLHVIRGGGWNRSYAAMAVTYRGAADASYQVPALGFRCVRDEPQPPPSLHDE